MYSNKSQSTTRLYRIWVSMRQRCNNPNNQAYKNYGGRGITVCQEWENSFQAFEDWAYSHGYREYLTIDRIDNDNGYSPDNCRWATMYEQAHNKRPPAHVYSPNNGPKPLYEINGVWRTTAEWAEIAGITRKQFRKRWGKGKRGAELIAPIQKRSSKQKKNSPAP